MTKEKRGDNICKHSARETRARLRNETKKARKRALKKLKKSFEKGLTKRYRCGILFELSRKRAANWTLKIKQRDKKRNPRFRWFKDHQKSFKKYFSNSNTEAKIAKY